MVKTLEIKTSEFVNLKKIKEDRREYASVDGRDYHEKVYMCDCDTFGGENPPCDCNK